MVDSRDKQTIREFTLTCKYWVRPKESAAEETKEQIVTTEIRSAFTFPFQNICHMSISGVLKGHHISFHGYFLAFGWLTIIASYRLQNFSINSTKESDFWMTMMARNCN